MTTEALHALFPDSKLVPDGDPSVSRSVAAFSEVVQSLQTEISITDCKVYSLPRFSGHRHEFTMVVANVDGRYHHLNCLIIPNVSHVARHYTTGKEVQVIFQRMGDIKTHTEESTVTVHLGP